jgi:acetylornithine/succinyldiaminopimelate/putrescine aminotransferase
VEKFNIIKEVRGKGLFIAIETSDLPSTHVNGNDLALLLMQHKGILAKATHDSCLRIAPVLNISDKAAEQATKRVISGVNLLKKLNAERKKEQK